VLLAWVSPPLDDGVLRQHRRSIPLGDLSLHSALRAVTKVPNTVKKRRFDRRLSYNGRRR
jgi:hypothetical protein